MSDSFDELDVVRGIVPRTQPSELYLQQKKDDLMNFIAKSEAAPSSVSRSWKSRKLAQRLFAAVAAVTVVGGAATAWAVTHQPASRQTSISCPDDTFIEATSGNPIADCAAKLAQQNPGSHDQLVAYASSKGDIVVRRSADPAPAGYTALESNFRQDGSVIELQRTLDDVTVGTPASCMSTDDATTFVRRDIQKLGLGGWTVTTLRKTSDAQPCVITNVDGTKQQVQLLALPRAVEVMSNAKLATFAKQVHDQVTAACLTPSQAVAKVNALIAADGQTGVSVSTSPSIDQCATPTVNITGEIEVTIFGK